MFKKWIIGLLFLALILIPFIKREKGFSLSKIRAKHPFDPRFAYLSPSDSCESILNQKFRYLSSGNHCYVFLSDDGKYVLKFFKQKHINPFSWRDFLPLPESMNPKRVLYRKNHAKLKDRTYKSYEYAHRFLPKETGVVYLHLTSSHKPHEYLTIVDQHEKTRKIQRDSFAFVLQKKAQVGFSYLDNLLCSNQSRRAFQGIANLLQVVEKRCELGLFDRDMQIFKNFGFLDHAAVEIDAGELYFASDAMGPNKEEEMQYITGQISSWLRENHPKYYKRFINNEKKN